MQYFFYFIWILVFFSNQVFAQWYDQESGTTASLTGVWFVDSLNGWVCGDSGIILNTSNGGENWLRQNSTVDLKLEDVFFWDLQKGWIAGDSGTVLHTTDGGNSWNIQQTSVTSSLNHIQLSTSQMGAASGEKGTLIITYNGGTTWQAMPNSDSGTTSISFYWIDTLRGTISFTDSSGGSQYYTLNGGTSWSSSVPPFFNVNDIWGYRIWEPPYHIDIYWDVGDEGKILNLFVIEENLYYYATMGHTTDSLNLYAVTIERGVENLKLWAVGEQGWIINSVDSGFTWQTIQSNVQNSLFDVSFPVKNQGWIVGNGGLILYNYQPTSVNNSIVSGPMNSYVSNPYPNPFNPSTKIKYSVPQISKVIIKVFDVLGNEIETLINEEKSSGTYEITWYAEGLPSGVYLYRLQAGDFIQTKKMMLMK